MQDERRGSRDLEWEISTIEVLQEKNERGDRDEKRREKVEQNRRDENRVGYIRGGKGDRKGVGRRSAWWR